MKRIVSLALVLVMVAMLFAGCGKTDQEKLVGVWQGEMDLTEALREALSETVEDMEIEKVAVTLLFTFTEEGSYTMKLDEESVKTAMDGLMETLETALKTSLESESEAMGMTADQALAALGMTMDEFVDAMIGMFEEMDLAGELTKNFKTQGKHLAEEGKLYMSNSVDTDPDKSEYFSYTLEGDVLTLTERVGGEASEEDMEMVFPVILKKIA